MSEQLPTKDLSRDQFGPLFEFPTRRETERFMNAVLPPLRPCPFCGVKARVRRASNDSSFWIVGCTSVRCRFHPELQHIDRAYAVKQWNKRFHP